MRTDDILAAIIRCSGDLSVIRRAARERDREYHTQADIRRLVQSALHSAGDYPPEVLEAMRQIDRAEAPADPQVRLTRTLIRCTPAEKAQLELSSARAGQSVSEYIRSRCLAEDPQPGIVPAAEARTLTVPFRCSQGEKARISRQAALHDMTLSDYIRGLCLKEEVL